jgi:hypothetical protein
MPIGRSEAPRRVIPAGLIQDLLRMTFGLLKLAMAEVTYFVALPFFATDDGCGRSSKSLTKTASSPSVQPTLAETLPSSSAGSMTLGPASLWRPARSLSRSEHEARMTCESRAARGNPELLQKPGLADAGFAADINRLAQRKDGAGAALATDQGPAPRRLAQA